MKSSDRLEAHKWIDAKSGHRLESWPASWTDGRIYLCVLVAVLDVAAKHDGQDDADQVDEREDQQDGAGGLDDTTEDIGDDDVATAFVVHFACVIVALAFALRLVQTTALGHVPCIVVTTIVVKLLPSAALKDALEFVTLLLSGLGNVWLEVILEDIADVVVEFGAVLDAQTDNTLEKKMQVF